MSLQDIAAAIRRVDTVLRRKPGAGLCDDEPAHAQWRGGLRVATRHELHGIEVVTDMPAEFGGHGDRVTPGWLMRAALASCASTRIAMEAASAGITLDALDVRATSRSDARGVLGHEGADGQPVPSGPLDVQLAIHVVATSVPAERLRALVDSSLRCSPVSSAMLATVPVTMQVDVHGAVADPGVADDPVER
jgi:uncharacterized OsmC-like protein